MVEIAGCSMLIEGPLVPKGRREPCGLLMLSYTID